VELPPPHLSTREAAEVPLGALASLTGLIVLDLRCWHATGSLDALAGVQGLTELRLDAQGLSGGLEGLRGLTNLEVLDISALPPGVPGARDCAAAPRGSPSSPPADWEGMAVNFQGEKPRPRYDLSVLGPGGGLGGDLAPLAPLKRLKFLRVEGTEIGGNLSALASLSDLEELHVGGNCLGGGLGPLEGLAALRRVTIPGKHPWSKLWGVWRNLFDRPCNGSAGLQGDLGAVSRLGGLEVLDLSWNGLEGNISAVENLTLLTEVALNENNIGGNILSMRNLTRLESLKLRGAEVRWDDKSLDEPLSLEGSLSEVGELTALTHLNVGGTRVAGEFRFLRNLSHLVYLEASRNFEFVDSDDLAALGMMTRLQHLDLTSAPMGVPLTHLKSLTYLEVDCLSSLDMADLRSLRSLKHLALKGLPKGGLDGDPDDLANLNQLTSLDLGYSRVPGPCSSALPAAGAFQGLGPDALSRLAGLERLRLAGTGWDVSERVSPVLGRMLELRYLELDDCIEAGTLGGVLGSHPKLKDISLSGNPQLGGDLSPLREARALVSLIVSESRISGDLTPLKDLRDLMHLDIENNSLTGGLEPLRGLTELTRLNLDGSNSLTGTLHPLRGLTELHTLYVNSVGLSGNLSALQGLSSMKYLDIGHNNLSGSLSPLRNMSLESLWAPYNNFTGSLAPLQNLFGLVALNVDGNDLSVDLDEFAGGLSGMQNLKKFMASGNIFSGDVGALSPLTSLEILNLNGHEGGRGGGVVGDLSFLSGMLNLTTVSIQNLQLPGSLEPLQNLTKLKSLRASGNDLSGNLSSIPGALAFLWLEDNKISGLGSGFHSSGVRMLNLGSNLVVSNVKDFVEDLPPMLLFLNISNNALRGDMKALIDGAKSKTEILDLFTSGNVGLTGVWDPTDTGRFRDIDWRTQSMGTWVVTKSGGNNSITVESRDLEMRNYTPYQTSRDKPSAPPMDFREFNSGQSVKTASEECETYSSTARRNEFDRAGSHAAGVDDTSGSAAGPSPLVFEAVQGQKFLTFCSGPPRPPPRESFGFREILPLSTEEDEKVQYRVLPIYYDLYESTGFPYINVRDPSEYYIENIAGRWKGGVPEKRFASFKTEVVDECGKSVCAFYNESVSWDYPDAKTFAKFADWEPQDENGSALTGSDANLEAVGGKLFWHRKPDEKRPHGNWPEELVDSQCVVDLEAVEQCLKDTLGNRTRVRVERSASVNVRVTGTFMSEQRWVEKLAYTKIQPDEVLNAWAKTADKKTFSTRAIIIFRRPDLLNWQSTLGIAAGTVSVAALSALLAGLVFRRRRRLHRLLSLLRTKEELQLALLEPTPPPRSIGKDMCFVSTDIQNSTVMRVHSLKAYEEAMQMHHNLLRQTLHEHGGVELLCEGDGFILGFDTAWAGTAFCCGLQQALQNVAWPPALQRLFHDVYKAPAGGRRGSTSGGGGSCLETARLCGALSPLSKFASQLEAFNGVRVRCGVHWVSEGAYQLERSGPNMYAVSGPGYERTRLIGDVGHGGQIVLSKAAQTMVLCNLQAAKYPIIRDLGLHRLFGASSDDALERLYQVTPSVGEAVKMRQFGPVRTALEVQPPLGSSRYLSRDWEVSGVDGAGIGVAEAGPKSDELTLVAVFVNCQKSFDKALDRSRIPEGAWVGLRRVVSDMKCKFLGWHLEVGKVWAALQRSYKGEHGDLESALGERGCDLDVDEVLTLTADFKAQEAAGQAWLLAFEDAQDAMLFCLSCCIELTYSSWEGLGTRRGVSSATTPDGAALWNGPPLGFTVHSVIRHSAGAGTGAGFELLGKRFVKGRIETIRGDVGMGLLETLVAAQLLPSNARVVLSGPAWACLNEGLGGQPAHFGKAVVEHLGRVRMLCLSRDLEVYQMLPVRLAGRASSFASLGGAAPGRLALLSPGARDAPRPTAHLTFVFTAWLEPREHDLLDLDASRLVGHDGTRLAAELQRLCRHCHDEIEAVCCEQTGYVVEEIGPCEFLLAFPSAASAVSFACAVQLGLHVTVCESPLLKHAGLAPTRPLSPSVGAGSRAEAGGAGAGEVLPFTGFLAAGVATVGFSGSPIPRGSGPSTEVLEGSGPSSAFRRRYWQGAASLAIANVHPVTGRCTYSTPAINKAARAKALARGGQVLLADLGVSSAQSCTSARAWMLSWRGASPPPPSLAQSQAHDSAQLLPPEMVVDTAAGRATTSLRALGGTSLRGFGGKVDLSELAADFPAGRVEEA